MQVGLGLALLIRKRAKPLETVRHQMRDRIAFHGSLSQMSRTKIDFDTVRKICFRLPDVQESKAWGSPALKARGQWLAVIPTHKSAEPNSLAVRVDFERRTELLESAPDIYYLKDHYENYPVVLVRLARISREALEGLLRMAWQVATTKKPNRE
jgi:hypothetical protein